MLSTFQLGYWLFEALIKSYKKKCGGSKCHGSNCQGASVPRANIRGAIVWGAPVVLPQVNIIVLKHALKLPFN
jgi:hypothetical protein